MKVDTRRVIQHANAAIMLGVCVSSFIYFLPFYYVKIGIILWVSSLIFVYYPDLFTFPGASKRNGRCNEDSHCCRLELDNDYNRSDSRKYIIYDTWSSIPCNPFGILFYQCNKGEKKKRTNF